MDIIIILLTAAGLFFFIAGTVGILRMPDVFTRIHAATKCDTLGVGLVALALFLSEGEKVGAVKILFIVGFLWITSATSSSFISSVAAHAGELEGITEMERPKEEK